MASVWFEGVEELNTIALELRAKSGRIGAQGARVVRSSAARVEANAKRIVPVDTGELRSSIGTNFSGDGRSGGMEAVISATADHSVWVEFGTSRQSPQSYMGPSLDREGPNFVAAVEAMSDPFD